MKNLKVATCQFPVSHDVERNAKYIARLMKKAADVGAAVAHFGETTLCGYGRTDLSTHDYDNWRILNEAMTEIIDLTSRLGIWTVLGSCRPAIGKLKPANCIFVISDVGGVSVYDKRKLTPSEGDWHATGTNSRISTKSGPHSKACRRRRVAIA